LLLFIRAKTAEDIRHKSGSQTSNESGKLRIYLFAFILIPNFFSEIKT